MSNCAIVGINWGDEGKGRMRGHSCGRPHDDGLL